MADALRSIPSNASIVVRMPSFVIEHAGRIHRISAESYKLRAPGYLHVRWRSLLRAQREIHLPFQVPESVVVTSLADGAVLGADICTIDRNWTARLKGRPGITATEIEISCRGAATRYDLLVFDPANARTSIIEGEERGCDVAEFRPKVPVGAVALAYIHLSADVEPEVVDLTAYVDQVRIGHSAERRGSIRRSQALLPNLRRKVRAREAIRLVGFGTSLTTQGGPTEAWFFKPNGPHRDCLRFYYENSSMQEDAIKAIALHPTDNGEMHTRVGWNWRLEEALRKESDSPVEYLNMGISGTTSGDGRREGWPSALDPERIAAVGALAADVVVVEFGMNDFKTVDPCANLVRIVEELRSPTTDVILLGVPGVPHAERFRHWSSVEDAIALAAELANVAHVPFAPLAHPNNTGAIGLATRTLCSVNGVNHPGPTEMAAYGRELARLADGLASASF